MNGNAAAVATTRASRDHLEALELYDELRQVADRWFVRQPAGHTLQATALANEAWLRIAAEPPEDRGRTHLRASAMRAMRQVLIDHARRRSAAKRGCLWRRVPLSEAGHLAAPREVGDEPILEALDRLSVLNDRQARIVELRFLAGLTVEETAAILELSPRMVKLEWRMARAWLLAQMR